MKTKDLSSKGKFLVRGLLVVVALVLLGNSQHVSAQWSPNATNIYYNGGNVGIGATSPSAKLDILSAGALGFRLLSGSNAAGQFAYAQIGRAAVDGTLGVASQTDEFVTAAAAGDVILRTESTVRKLHLSSGPGAPTMTLSAGSVGIGTPNPTTMQLHLSGAAASGGGGIKFTNTSSSGKNYIMGSGVGGAALFSIHDLDNAATRFTIHIGDLLVTSDIAGVAMKSEPITIGNRKMHMPGTLIGKALEPLEKGSGKILVLLSLQ
jgi:hypothetical protein